MMKKYCFLFTIGILSVTNVLSQDNVFAFYEYDIRLGMDDQFINGYAKDLEWHKAQGDDWSWIGWFVLNGERRGRFIDATPGHAWEDFDNWKVNRAENGRHNKIHWLPYVEKPSGSYRILLAEHSTYTKDWITDKFLQVYRIKVREGKDHIFTDFLTKYRPFLESHRNKRSFVWMKTVSGGGVNEYLLFVAMDKIGAFEICQSLFSFSKSQKELAKYYADSVEENTSELWGYSEKLSLIAN